MSEVLPEIDYDISIFSKLEDTLRERLPSFRINSLSYWEENGERVTASNPSELIRALGEKSPRYRLPIEIQISFLSEPNSKKSIRGQISLGIDAPNSIVSVYGGTAKLKKDHAVKVLSVFKYYERSISNGLGKGIFGYLIVIFNFIFNYLRPDTIFNSSAGTSVAIASISLPLYLFFHYRPHSFIRIGKFDYIRIIPLRAVFTILLMVTFVLCAIKAPTLLGRDQSLVLKSPEIQRELLRDLLTPERLRKFEDLKKANKQFDLATGLDDKASIARSLSSIIFDLVNKDSGMSKFPIGLLKIFPSYASALSQGNWLHEPMLLSAYIGKAEGIDAIPHFKYVPRILSGRDHHYHVLGISDWLDEPVIKDKFGAVFTRYKIVDLNRRDSLGTLSDREKQLLERMRKFPEDKLEFKYLNNDPTTPENSVEDETIRAISEELVNAGNAIQQLLSANPESVFEDRTPK